MAMHSMCRLDCIVLEHELKKLEGAFFNKAFWHGENVFRIKLNKGNITFSLGEWIMAEKPESEPNEQPFSELMRRELDNQNLEKIEFVNGDRLLRMKFRTAMLYVEMFGRAKAVLVDNNGKTIGFFVKDNREKPEIEQEYKMPETMPLEAKAHTREQEKKPVGAILARMIGKVYSKYILEKEGIAESAMDYGAEKIDALAKKWLALAKPYAKPDFSDYAVLPVFENAIGQETLSGAIKKCVGNAEKANPELEKLKNARQRMMETIGKYREKAKECREKGDFIYANYEETEKALAHAKGMETDDFLRKRKATIDKKEKSVELDLGGHQD
jgi:predicted ribosome quality control (RQC) complex YloA/Tae2 family protein